MKLFGILAYVWESSVFCPLFARSLAGLWMLCNQREWDEEKKESYEHRGSMYLRKSFTYT